MSREMKLRPTPPATISSSAGGTEFRVNAWEDHKAVFYLDNIFAYDQEGLAWTSVAELHLTDKPLEFLRIFILMRIITG